MDANAPFGNCFLCQSTFERWRSLSGQPPPHLLKDFYQFVREFSKGGRVDNLIDCEILSICTCEDCTTLLESVMDEKISVDEEEAHVRKLQLELLAELNKLQKGLNVLSEKMKMVAGRIGPHDCEDILVPEKTVHAGGNDDAEIYRKQIVNAVRSLSFFQENLGTRVKFSTGESTAEEREDLKSEPYSADSEVKIELALEEIKLEQEDNSDVESSAAREDLNFSESYVPDEAEKCDEEFSSDEVHASSSSAKDTEMISCKLCGKEFRKVYIRFHMKKVHSGKYQCPKCDKKWSSREILQRHMEHSHETRKIPCQLCGKTFATNVALSAHMVNAHGQEPTEPELARFRCKLCGKQCVTRKGLRQHQETHLAPEERTRKVCLHCKKAFHSAELLELHISRNCDALHKQVICSQCGKCFENPRKLRDHEKVHSEDNLTCDLCGKGGFKHSTALTQHKARHSARRDFVCEHCGGGFKTKVDLTKHKYKCDGSKKPKKLRRSAIIIFDDDNSGHNE